MKVTLKLYATLAAHLPAQARRNEVALEVPEGETIGALLDRYNVPRKSCHLILVNGRFAPPAEADDTALAAGDTVAVWPPIAGG